MATRPGEGTGNWLLRFGNRVHCDRAAGPCSGGAFFWYLTVPDPFWQETVNAGRWEHMMPGFVSHFVTFADYNAWANARLYDVVAGLSDEALSVERPAAFFTSILGTLNHVLVADGIWMDRFEHLPPAGLKLDTVLHDDLRKLRAARKAEDARIRRFVAGLQQDDIDRAVTYCNSKGEAFTDPLGRLLTHFFNHQTHHRGQAHALIKEAGAAPPALDYIFYMREVG